MTTAKYAFAEICAAAETFAGPRWLPWPVAGNPGGHVDFPSFADWRDFFLQFNLHPAVPEIVKAKFTRAMKLHLLAWIDVDLIKAGELAAWTAIELALTDVYKGQIMAKRRATAAAKGKKASEKVTLFELFRYMEHEDGLTDAEIPLIQKSGGSVIGRLTGKRQPALNQLRNDLAHGYPFDGFPQSGLIELLRDLIEYAYRDRVAAYNAGQR